MKNSKVYIIVAVEENFGIGKNGVMPWRFKNETKFFKDTTSHVVDSTKMNAVVMGHRTWLSLPEKHRPLAGRKNVVLTREDQATVESYEIAHSPESAIASLKADENIETIFIIGGASIYKYCIENVDMDGLYITKIRKNYDCDTFFPAIPNDKYKTAQKLLEDEEDGTKLEYFLFTK